MFEHPMSVQWYLMYPVRRGLLTSLSHFSKDSANPCMFQQCARDVNDLTYVTGAYVLRWQRPESKTKIE